VGAVNFKVWENELKEGKIDSQQISVIWQTPKYPDYNWTIRGDADKTFGENFIKKVQTAVVNMKDPDLLASFPRSAFIPADNTMYQPILEVGTEIGIIRN
jgi:phosphonate transport system substrate-binding protein